MIRPLLRSALPNFRDSVTIQLEGARVTARFPVVTDWHEWAMTRGVNYAALKAYEPSWPADALTEHFFKRRLARQIRDWHDDRGYSFLLFERAENRLIGGFNLNNVSRGAAQYASLGYWLDKDSQGQGYMTEAARLIIGHAFLTLGLHRLNAGILPHNDRSRRLLERLGFEEEGFAKRYVKIDGKWEDHALFGLTNEDWMDSGSLS